MKVIYIHKEEVHKRPPVLSAISHIASLGHQVALITCGINEPVRQHLSDLGVDIHILPYCKAKSSIGKLREYAQFRSGALKLLRVLYDEHSVIWVEAGATAVALGRRLLRFRYILQIQELHHKERYTLRVMARLTPSAQAVFVPEYNRAVLYQVWFHLKSRPFVLPNIPAFFATNEEIKKYNTKYDEVLSRLQGKFVIIYQGYISVDRPLGAYIKAVKELGDHYQVLLVGRNYGALRAYKSILPDLIHIDYLPSPEYLFFTQHAHLGIVTYDPLDLNNAYCAPNKIFEYAHYGLPVLGNDIPGLKFLIEPFASGKIVDESDVESIKSAILEIDRDYERYSLNAKRMIDSYDNQETINRVLNSLGL